MAETLATGSHIPLGKHLLGSVYHLLHQVAVKLRSDQPIGNLGGPWWFIQLWLNMYMHKTMGLDLRNMSFPSKIYAQGQQIQVCRCTSFGESASMIANENFGMTHFFNYFYNGFVDESGGADGQGAARREACAGGRVVVSQGFCTSARLGLSADAPILCRKCLAEMQMRYNQGCK